MSSLPFDRTVLPNGVRLLLIPIDGVNSVATSVMVGVGSRYETPAINGISHFLEHMVFKGTQKYPTTDDVNIIERAGGLQNAYTDIDITNYHNKVLSTDWELALDINKELSLHPRIDEEHVERERNVILEEMKRYEDEPEAKVDEAYHGMLYRGTKLGMRIIGERESLLSVAAQELHEYHDTWYTPERLIIVVAGRVKNNELRIKEKATEWFSHNSSFIIRNSEKSAAEIEKVTENQSEPRLSVVTKPDAQQAHLMLGIRTFRRGSDERFAWSVFNLLMGVSFTSRLFKEIREKRGLCYHIRSSSTNWADVGNWSIYAGVATDKIEEATTAIMAELTKAVDAGVTDDEVAVAKKRLQTIIAFKSEDPEFQNEFYGRQELFGEPVLTLEKYLGKIAAVTKDEINGLLKKYITQKTLNMALVWNKPREEKLVNLLKI